MPGFDDDDEESRPVPHPLDRPWIHPSELGAARAPRPAPARPSWRRDGLLALTAGALGALAAVTALALLGAFDTEPAPAQRTSATPVTDAAALATAVAPGVGAVTTALGTDAERRGSGVVVGVHELLTTADVVAGAAQGAPVRVALGDGRQHHATVRAVDPLTQLALVEVPGVRMQPARFGEADAVRAGDWVVAIGRTASNGPWVTSGVVTATGGWIHDTSGTAHAGLIATNTELADAARGGALVDGQGHVVGILATVSADSDRAAAMPADMADAVATQLREQGHASHGSLGVRATDSARGPVVTEVVGGSAADHAKLRVGDHVVAVDSMPTPDTATLVYELRRRSAGARAALTVERGKARLRVGVILDDAATASGAGGATPASLTAAGG